MDVFGAFLTQVSATYPVDDMTFGDTRMTLKTDMTHVVAVNPKVTQVRNRGAQAAGSKILCEMDEARAILIGSAFPPLPRKRFKRVPAGWHPIDD